MLERAIDDLLEAFPHTLCSPGAALRFRCGQGKRPGLLRPSQFVGAARRLILGRLGHIGDYLRR